MEYLGAQIAHQTQQDSSIAGPGTAVETEAGLQHGAGKDKQPAVYEDGKDHCGTGQRRGGEGGVREGGEGGWWWEWEWECEWWGGIAGGTKKEDPYTTGQEEAPNSRTRQPAVGQYRS